MEIIINDNRVNQERFNITGEIFFKTDNGCFPEENWNDFVLIIVGNWINEYLSFLNSNGRGKFTLCFMDGSFEVVGVLQNSGTYLLEYVRRYIDNREIIFTEIVSETDFEKQITRTCRKCLRIANQFNRKTEIGNFGEMLDKLKNLYYKNG